MTIDMKNPAAWADADRAPNLFKLPGMNGSEITPHAFQTQDFRAAFIARRCGLSREFALIVAPLAFGMEVTP